jgi:hypothetical protein
MGVWGTGISSNDTFADIYEQFIDLYNEGLSVPEITKRLIDENQETINLPEDATNFWFALAYGQWECKALDSDVLLKVDHIIQTGEDLRIWEELDASPADLKAREKVLTKFLVKLQTEKDKDKPRKRSKKKLYDSIFKKGDCLIYKMDNSNYGGAFVLTDEQGSQVGENYIAITTIDKATKPTIDDFKSAEVYVKRVNEISFNGTEMRKKWVDQPQIGGFYAFLFKRHNVDIKVIGQLPIYKEYKIRKDRQVGYGWIVLKSMIPFKDEYIKLNGTTKLRLKLSEWTKKHWL